MISFNASFSICLEDGLRFGHDEERSPVLRTLFLHIFRLLESSDINDFWMNSKVELTIFTDCPSSRMSLTAAILNALSNTSL
ncbi:hypothetical protein, partial [Streptococcus mutans]|uniref:hypothetical protein n=2 Tax=Streptococcus mutans TaxID=1309 RepID=UPI001ED9A01D